MLDIDPDTQLKWSDFQSWARGIAELFKKESPVVYYAAYIAVSKLSFFFLLYQFALVNKNYSSGRPYIISHRFLSIFDPPIIVWEGGSLDNVGTMIASYHPPS